MDECYSQSHYSKLKYMSRELNMCYDLLNYKYTHNKIIAPGLKQM